MTAMTIVKKEPQSIHISSSKFSVYFTQKNLLFLFYTSTFTNHPHQFIYSTHLFIKIFIILRIFIIHSLTVPLSHKLIATITTTITTQPPSPPSSETKQKTDINPHEKSSETKEKSDQPTYRSTYMKNHQKPKKNQINPYISINPHEKSDSTSDQPTPINPHKENQHRSKRHRLHASTPPRLHASTHTQINPQPKSTQTKQTHTNQDQPTP